MRTDPRTPLKKPILNPKNKQRSAKKRPGPRRRELENGGVKPDLRPHRDTTTSDPTLQLPADELES